MNTMYTQEAQELINGIKRARTEIANLASISDLNEWQRNKREFELCQAIDLMKSSMVELMERTLTDKAA